VGCGAVRIPGWVNIDSSARSAAADLIWDVTDGIPCDDESCALVYNEHFLEHLAVDQGLAFLKECRRVLEPGGVVRVAMPDLAETVRQYVDNDWAEQPWVKKYGFQWIKTRCERLNIGFRWWGHQWLYDREELHRRLGEAGFADVRDAAWGESEVPQLRARETRPETQLICEAWK
jgi:predicted SAM-dependent methyltransferase